MHIECQSPHFQPHLPLPNSLLVAQSHKTTTALGGQRWHGAGWAEGQANSIPTRGQVQTTWLGSLGGYHQRNVGPGRLFAAIRASCALHPSEREGVGWGTAITSWESGGRGGGLDRQMLTNRLYFFLCRETFQMLCQHCRRSVYISPTGEKNSHCLHAASSPAPSFSSMGISFVQTLFSPPGLRSRRQKFRLLELSRISQATMHWLGKDGNCGEGFLCSHSLFSPWLQHTAESKARQEGSWESFSAGIYIQRVKSKSWQCLEAKVVSGLHPKATGRVQWHKFPLWRWRK